jgi:hypothetical protein
MNLNSTDSILYKGTNVAILQPASQVKKDQTEHDGWGEEMDKLYNKSIENLDKDQQVQVKELLNAHKTVFSQSGELGRTNVVYHKIDTGDARPKRQSARRSPHHQREEARRQVEDMLDKGIISPSSSPWASPVVLVRKKDGTIRFCVDYRELNKVTFQDAYPLPRIDDSLDALSGSRWFSSLDLASGYWQVEMDRNDRSKTAFTTGTGLYEYNVMPFGLCNAPGTFERLMELVLSGLHWQTCLVYLDDILIFAPTFEEHFSRLSKVSDRLVELV